MNKRIQEAFEKWFCEMTSDKEISFVQDSRGMMEKMGRDLDIMDVSKLQGFYAGYLAALPKWVSVEDQLPVLRDGVACARFLTIPITGEGPVIMLYFADDQRWSQFSDDTQMVTHWQPLPPVPVEGDE